MTLPYNESERDYRELYTAEELDALIERFICLFTREPSHDFNHTTEEMLAVLQQAKCAAYYQSQLAALRPEYDAMREAIWRCTVVPSPPGLSIQLPMAIRDGIAVYVDGKLFSSMTAVGREEPPRTLGRALSGGGAT